MRTLFIYITIFICAQSNAQDKLYPNEFALSNVQLLDGPFKHARDLNIETLLKYNVDRLLAGYRKEAGLPPKDSSYKNWDGLDGHVGGHYLSALAMNYAATGNAACRHRMEYMIEELKACQQANEMNNADWARRYIGAVPNSKKIWSTLQKGDFTEFRAAWVPWYNVHKMYAGLRDVWLYAGNEDAKIIFLKFCDWAINITAGLSDQQMQSMLDIEYGGMNEILADAYQVTNDEKYLTAAKRFSHNMLFDAMAAEKDNLDNKHANTQVPKAIGFARIGEISDDDKFEKAGRFFWQTVTTNRSLAFGGNSRREFFPSVAGYNDFINDVEGPESCNSYNMLKLTEVLFRTNPSAKYVDYYERTLYNHILSTQHPVNGGYVYFTPARPRHYRVYSSPNQGMWCCVGSGMENHSKYNQFIYTSENDRLFLNLFIASELTWKEKGIKIRQETQFPFEEKTKLVITEGSSNFKLMIRHPSWVSEGDVKILVNQKAFSFTSHPSSYITIDRVWKEGDIVEVILPMQNSIEQLPNAPNFIAFMHGPILLAARAGTEDLKGLVADDSRWGHIASGKRLPINEAPIIIDDNIPGIIKKIGPSNQPLTFSTSQIKMVNPINIVFEPFFTLHDSRYMMYWMALSSTQYQSYLDSISTIEKEKLALQKRTIDFVAPGEQQPEADHAIQLLNSNSGNHLDEFWRDARNEGWFSYKFSTNKETDLSLIVRYWGAEWGNRKFDIYIDDEKLVTEDNTGKWNQSKFIDVEYLIPGFMVKEKDKVRIKFQALKGNVAGAVYYLRLVRANKQAINPIIFADVPDMSMIRVDDTYYMSSTTMHMSPGVPVMRSKDLVNWKLINYAYDTLANVDELNLNNGKSTYGKGSWASCMRYHNKTYYVTTFAQTTGKTHVFSTKNIEKGPWKVSSFQPSYHDHTIFFDDDGRVYLIYGGGKLKIVELNADVSGVKPGTSEQVIIENASLPAGNDIALNAEGSQLFKVNGKYYLFNIVWPKNGMRTVLIHRADKITGPYEGRVALQDLGVAQGGLIDTPEGDWYAYLFRDYGSVGRIPYLVPVKWEDGWPVLGINGKVPEKLDLSQGKGLLPNIVASDEFTRNNNESSLPLVWQWNHNPDNSLWSVTKRKGYLRLATGRIDTSFLSARNTLTQRTIGPSCMATTSIDVSNMKDGDFAGLALLQKNYGIAGIKINGSTRSIVMINASTGIPLTVQTVPLDQSVVYFKAHCDFTNKKDTANFYYSLDGKQWITIGTPLKMTYTLPHFMGYRFGLFNYATKTTGGFADFDWFRIKQE